jgi:hypothetical protein
MTSTPTQREDSIRLIIEQYLTFLEANVQKISDFDSKGVTNTEPSSNAMSTDNLFIYSPDWREL